MSNHDTEERLSEALNGMVGDRPYLPDLEQIECRGRKLRHRRLAWRVTAGTSIAAAAIAAVAVATSGTGAHAPAPNLAAQKPTTTSSATTGSTSAGSAENTPLVQLVGYLTTAEQPTGDATLMLRDRRYTTGLKVDVWDLYADNGDYYFAKTRAGISAQVKGHHTRKTEDGYKNEVAAAKQAATGDLNEARKKMARAWVPKNLKVKPTLEAPGVTPTLPAGKVPERLKAMFEINKTDNRVWNNSMDALTVGAGSPTVRAGVLRLLGQMPEIKVKTGTLNGQPVLTLTADTPASPGSESLTVNANTGLPVKYTGADVGVTVNYTVTRVTLVDLAKGKF
jgi:hypothetical protein